LRSPIFYVSPTHLRKLRVEYKVEDKEYRNRDNAYQKYSDKNHPLFGLPKQDALKRWDILFEQIQNGYDDRYPLVLDFAHTNERLRLFDGHHRLSIVIELKYTHVPIQFREKAFGNLNMLFDSKESKIIMKRQTKYLSNRKIAINVPLIIVDG
jgi:hypothetical protein